MKQGMLYKVTLRIKVHTSPLREITYDKIGMFVKETDKSYVFDDFHTRKSTVVKIEEVIG